jgi:hypothetical protein
VNVGDPVLFRSIYAGNVRWCFPSRYVGDWEGRDGLYCQPGNEGKCMARGADGRYLEHWANGVPPTDLVGDKGHVLRFMRPGDAHTIEICWDRDWRHVCWYVNLQAPPVVRGDRFDQPAEPFVAMTEGTVARFPAYPPYGGIHDRIVPHLTVAQAELDETAARVQPLLPLRSRVETVVLYEHVDANTWREVHTFGL